MGSEFISLVANMREAQKSFFATKDMEQRRKHLQDSKRLERQVDEYLRTYLNDGRAALFSSDLLSR